MGNFIKKPSKISVRNLKNIDVTSKQLIAHKAQVLTVADVEADRSKAYRYLSF